MRVRIKARPAVPEIDGVDLRGMTPGSVREVSALIAAWLVAEGYAEPEMRRTGADTPPSAESGGLTIPDRRSRHRF